METDVLVIGGGVAGLTVAWKSKGAVIVATKAKLGESNTRYAQGGIAAALGKDDAPRLHVQDTLRAGDGLVKESTARTLAQNIPLLVRQLYALGVPFQKEGVHFKLSREAVHSRARIVHVSDSTGKAVSEGLLWAAKKKARMLDECLAVRLLLSKGTCVGCLFLDLKKKRLFPIFAKAVVLATGGAGQLYSHSTNPSIATADGVALAYEAGASVEDLEFMQFHPTCLAGTSFLISETLRGEGGILKNKFGEAFMRKYHRDGELAPRDVVAKFSLIEMQRTKTKNVWLDVRHLGAEYLKKRFPMIYGKCLERGVDLTKEMIPVSPAAHYQCGGIRVDSEGRTNVNGLFAVGECSSTGLHGADRLASNSLAEGLVFGSIVAKELQKKGFAKPQLLAQEKSIHEIDANLKKLHKFNSSDLKKIRGLRIQLQEEMWKNVGILRTMKGLEIAKRKLGTILLKAEKILEKGISKEPLELRNLCVVGLLV
ncbi:MAG: FAD-binding protein, partial [Nanoarchaeota archaeon]|nr:FAD-binding protein [Nanoarchaeota archaeon]